MPKKSRTKSSKKTRTKSSKKASTKSAKKARSQSPRKVRSKARPAAAAPGPKKRVVVVYKHLDDPSTEQKQSLHRVLEHLRHVNIIGEIPGSLHLDVAPEEEDPLRHAVDQLPDWDLSEEGHARMPRQSFQKGDGHEP